MSQPNPDLDFEDDSDYTDECGACGGDGLDWVSCDDFCGEGEHPVVCSECNGSGVAR